MRDEDPQHHHTLKKSTSLHLLLHVGGARVDDLRVVRIDLADQALLLELSDGGPRQRPVDLQAFH